MVNVSSILVEVPEEGSSGDRRGVATVLLEAEEEDEDIDVKDTTILDVFSTSIVFRIIIITVLSFCVVKVVYTYVR